MKPLKKLEYSETQPKILRTKRVFGTFYGMVAGITFACASWGLDGYVLSRSHGYLPWFSLTAGIVLCSIVGGLLGWLTARMENSFIGLGLWCIGALSFAALIVALPLQITPYLVSKINPQLGALLDYGSNIEFMLRFGVALAWIAPFAIIIGVTQIPMIEPAVFSTSVFGKIKPFLFCVVVMTISGYISDNLINEQFRLAVTGLDKTIQFVVENQNNASPDPKLLRENHAGALNAVAENVNQTRHLFVGSYDEFLGEIHVLVNFDGPWLDCRVLYGQPSTCKIAETE